MSEIIINGIIEESQEIEGRMQYARGTKGDDGVTFTPSVDANGNISWTNDGGRTNPETRNIKGQKGDDGDSGVYIGSTPPTDPDVKVWIDTSGEAGDVEMTANKSTSISELSTDTQYSSAKAVYNATKDSIKGGTAYKRKLDNLINAAKGIVYTDETDETAAYKKTILSGTQKYGFLNSVGGKTVVWNQKINYNGYTEGDKTVAGVSYTNNHNGTFTINGTAIANSNLYIDSVSLVNGHKYCILGLPEGASSSTFGYQVDNYGAIYANSIFSVSNTYSWALVRIKVISGATVSNAVITPQFFDLTKMFGSGNEPTTVAQFKAMFPSDYYAYNGGELLIGKCNKVVSEGRNLFNIVNYGTGEGQTNYIDVSNLEVGTTYYISAQDGTDLLRYKISQYVGGIAVWQSSSKAGAFIEFTAEMKTTGKLWLVNTSQFAATKAQVIGMQICFHKSDASFNGQYVPYFKSEYSINADIQALDGYGWSAGSAYNYVNYDNTHFIKKVGRVDLGTLEWTLVNGRFNTTVTINDIKTSGSDYSSFIVCSEYESNNSPITSQTVNKTIATYDKKIYVLDSAYSSAAAFKTAMNGVYLYYELANVVVVDISQYITDNAIEVEVGGTVTFEQQNSTRLNIPSKQTYMVKVSDAI